jgi:hypothetical protein
MPGLSLCIGHFVAIVYVDRQAAALPGHATFRGAVSESYSLLAWGRAQEGGRAAVLTGKHAL